MSPARPSFPDEPQTHGYDVVALIRNKEGTLFASDRGHHRVSKITISGNQGFFSTFAGGKRSPILKQNSAPVDGPPNEAILDPYEMAFDQDGNLFVLEDPALRKIAPDGTVTTVGSAGLPTCFGVAIGPDGAAYLTDAEAFRVYRVDLKTKEVTIWFDHTPAKAPKFGQPGYGFAGCAFDMLGNFWVIEAGSATIRKFSADGELLLMFVFSTTIGNNWEMVVDPSGEIIYVSEGDRITKLNQETGDLEPVILNMFGQALCLDHDGSLWFCSKGEEGNFQVFYIQNDFAKAGDLLLEVLKH